MWLISSVLISDFIVYNGLKGTVLNLNPTNGCKSRSSGCDKVGPSHLYNAGGQPSSRGLSTCAVPLVTQASLLLHLQSDIIALQ